VFELKPSSGQLSAYLGENLDLDSCVTPVMSLVFAEVDGDGLRERFTNIVLRH
jgi:hypothetical protein